MNCSLVVRGRRPIIADLRIRPSKTPLARSRLVRLALALSNLERFTKKTKRGVPLSHVRLEDALHAKNSRQNAVILARQQLMDTCCVGVRLGVPSTQG